jgi:alanyl-tRNA synthetase
MKGFKLAENFLHFFEKRDHKILPSFSLIPDDPSCLFTTAGMQPFKAYYLGKPCPWGKRVATLQKCFRTSDIESVGDRTHLTFLLMLGNFSFGDYFKKEAITWAKEFLFDKLKLSKKGVKVTVFEGEKEVPFDKESAEIWKSLGFENIEKKSREDNFWGPTGEEGPCGRTTEIIFGEVEVWNLVFNEYYQDKEKKLHLLSQKGVDTGMGLERLTMIVQKKPSIFETDLFEEIIKNLVRSSQSSYKENPRVFRILADHLRAGVFLIADGIYPGNLEREYVLRRILRRCFRFERIVGLSKKWYFGAIKEVIKIYSPFFPEIQSKSEEIFTVFENEDEKFKKTLDKALKFLENLFLKKREKIISGKEAFDLYQSYGFPLELTQEVALEKGFIVEKEKFFEELKKHQEISKRGQEKKFGGGGYLSPKHHTATHLLHSALREILGKDVRQMGSDITEERLRFDFKFSGEIKKEEILKIENLVNQKIKENLIVKKEEMPLKKAMESGALAFFRERYPEVVSVYTIFNPKTGEVFSKEICAGPHVQNTKELGTFKIEKFEKKGANIWRVRAKVI